MSQKSLKFLSISKQTTVDIPPTRTSTISGSENYILTRTLTSVNEIQLETCQDQISQYIPHLDGFTPNTCNQCDNCRKVFETGEQLEHRKEIYQFGCEDCHLCFTAKYHFVIHELKEHPETVYALSVIPHMTIDQATIKMYYYDT